MIYQYTYAQFAFISHTHWDREWYLPFQLFRLKLVHRFNGKLDLFAKDIELQNSISHIHRVPGVGLIHRFLHPEIE